MKLNKEFHSQNVVPKNASFKERVKCICGIKKL